MLFLLFLFYAKYNRFQTERNVFFLIKIINSFYIHQLKIYIRIRKEKKEMIVTLNKIKMFIKNDL